MRFFLVFLFLLVLLAGAGAAIVYPWTVASLPGREIERWQVYERGKGFREVTHRLASADAPVQVVVDLTTIHQIDVSARRTLLTIEASNGHGTVLAETLSFSESAARETSPQLPERVYREEAGTIAEIEDGDYTFTLAPAALGGMIIKSVELTLLAGAGSYDPRVQPVGFSVMAIGFIGLVLALRRGRPRPPQNPNSQPPPPRWGRGAKSGG